MTIGQIDVAVRSMAAAVILLLAWLLLGQWRRIGLPALLFPMLAVCLAGFVAGNTPLAPLRPGGAVGVVAHLASGFTVVFLWWFCLSCFDRRFELRGGVLAGGWAWAVIAAADRGLLGERLSDWGLSRLLVPLGFAIVGHLVWRLLAERQGDLVGRRHDARVVVAVLLGGMLFIDLAADALFGFAWRPIGFALAQNAMILGFGLWLAKQVLAVRPEVLTFRGEDAAPLPAGAAPTAPGRRDDVLYRRLVALIEGDRVFLDPELTFAGFVAQMGATDRAVRTLVNRDLGFDHFRIFLNHHRVAEARRLLADGRRDDKLVAVALDSGFASLASFNRAFRAIEGRSPSAFRDAARRGQADAAGVAHAGF